ncbi:hypothetical protein MTR67_025705 [Solanum verrucosum]|uniref:Uncharacterized protein n=1 Tax=Solanum verrucosum TaxID=315347 RepID=A0AAF0TYX4_SOLVR|nr:hypothetical protein MTR67_025705 [Solanum verrucosum]
MEEMKNNSKIVVKLRISYDLLEAIKRDIFLDIACFFRGKDKDYIMKILESCYSGANIGLCVLIDKSLVFISINNTIEMHDLKQEMGKHVVKMHKDLGEPSRIWNIEDFKEVIDNNTVNEGLRSLEILNLSFCNLIDGGLPEDIGCLSSLKELHLNGNIFVHFPKSIAQLGDLETLNLPYPTIQKCNPEISFLLIPLSGLWDTSKANGRTPNDYGLFMLCFYGEMKYYGLRLLYKVDPELDANFSSSKKYSNILGRVVSFLSFKPRNLD